MRSAHRERVLKKTQEFRSLGSVVKTRFGPFTLDSETRQLLRDGDEVHLPRKAFDLLSTLLAHRPKVVDKDELHAASGPTAMSTRRAQRPGRRRAARPWRRRQAAAVHSNRAWSGIRVLWRCGSHRRAAAAGSRGGLLAGVGRPAVSVGGGRERHRAGSPLPGLARCRRGCHAGMPASSSIRTGSAARLRDLESTNGTFLGRSRVGQPVELDDGDEVKVGSVVLKFRRWFPERAPETRRIRRKNPPPRPD